MVWPMVREGNVHTIQEHAMVGLLAHCPFELCMAADIPSAPLLAACVQGPHEGSGRRHAQDAPQESPHHGLAGEQPPAARATLEWRRQLSERRPRSRAGGKEAEGGLKSQKTLSPRVSPLSCQIVYCICPARPLGCRTVLLLLALCLAVVYV